jgi:tetratricopeptide (TPR) repeat protein
MKNRRPYKRTDTLDRYELKVSLDEIDSLIAERRFREAAELADTIDWTRVRGVHVLCRISDLYKINKRYKDSRDLMEMAYERNPSGRKIIYSLCELELKLNNYIHALQLYNAFINVAPRDADRFLLQYKLYKKQDVNVYEQIAVLEEFLQHDFRERWAYELATLYLRAGEEQRCISQCDEIVAYFGDGRFVIRALELKKSLTPLTPQQEERLQILKSGGTIAPPAPVQETVDASEAGSGKTGRSGSEAAEDTCEPAGVSEPSGDSESSQKKDAAGQGAKPAAKPAPTPEPEGFKEIVADLKARKCRTGKRLRNAIKSYFNKTDETEIDRIIEAMINGGYMLVAADGHVTWIEDPA